MHHNIRYKHVVLTGCQNITDMKPVPIYSSILSPVLLFHILHISYVIRVSILCTYITRAKLNYIPIVEYSLGGSLQQTGTRYTPQGYSISKAR